MAHINIKNIGPIKNVQNFELDRKRFNVIIGAQSSGKSTIAKILCYCTWVEKYCSIDFEKRRDEYLYDNYLYKRLVEYHRLYGYFNEDSSFEYYGDKITIKYEHKAGGNITIEQQKKVDYEYRKICYIPSERNFVASILNFNKWNNNENDILLNFGYDWNEARTDVSEMSMAEVLDRNIVYKYREGGDYITDNDSELQLRFASSGVISITPLYVTIQYLLDNIYQKESSLSIEQKTHIIELSAEMDKSLDYLKKVNNSIEEDNRIPSEEFKANLVELTANTYFDVFANMPVANNLISTVTTSLNLFKDRYERLKRCFDYNFSELFIEEPEQNLFPTAQMNFVNELFLLLNNSERKHRALITTHSPYILFAINNCIMRHIVKDNIPDKGDELLNNKATIDPKDISIYQIENGELKRIQDEDGNLDENFINDAYKANSTEYFSLLNFYDDEE